MPSPLSVDLRQRVVSAISEGASCHQAATRFGVSVSSASRWSEQFRQDGQLTPKPSGGDHASHRIEAQAELILTTYEAQSAIFLHELRDALAERGVQTSTSSLSRFFARDCQEFRVGAAIVDPKEVPDGTTQSTPHP